VRVIDKRVPTTGGGYFIELPLLSLIFVEKPGPKQLPEGWHSRNSAFQQQTMCLEGPTLNIKLTTQHKT
jgi:hypothetical protein